MELYDDLLSALPQRIHSTPSEHDNFIGNSNQIEATQQHRASQSTNDDVVIRRTANNDQGEDNTYDDASSIQLQNQPHLKLTLSISQKTCGPSNQLAPSPPPIPPRSETTTPGLVKSTSKSPPVPPRSSEIWLEQLPTSTEMHTTTRDATESYVPPVPLRRESLPSDQGSVQEGISRKVDKCHSSVPQSRSKPLKKLSQTRARKTTPVAAPQHTASLYEDVLPTVQQSFMGKKRLTPQPYEIVVPKTLTQTTRSHIN